MSNIFKKTIGRAGIIVVLLLACITSGCALGTTGIGINHEPLEKIVTKKQGTILLRQFADQRKEQHEYIGNKRNMYGMVLGHIGTEEGVSLEPLITGYVAEALTEAGYTTIRENSAGGDPAGPEQVDAIVEGEILDFWLDLYMKVWHRVELNVRALSADDQYVLWEKKIDGAESNVLWIGANSEFERVINSAVTKALNKAAQEFATEEFADAVLNQQKDVMEVD